MSPATVAKHYRSLQQLFVWLVDDGEIDRSPMERMRPPSVPEQPVAVLTIEELGALLATCRGNTFENRRDLAIIRVFVDTGMRAGELAGLTTDDIDLELNVAQVLGKGRRSRTCPFGAKTAEALRRYLRLRRSHALAQQQELWLGRQGPLSDSGVRQMLERRATDAGVPHVHPHRFRHTSPIFGWPKAARRTTSCGWQAGGPERWLVGTRLPSPTSAPGTRTNAWASVTA